MQIDRFKVEEWFNEYEHKSVYDLADTCVESLSINDLIELTGADYGEIFNQKLNYGAIHGSERLKSAVCSLYKNQLPENITVTHGAIGANQLVMLTLIERGDKVVSVVPTYQQHYSIPKSIGAEVKMYFLKEENDWLPDLNEFEKIVGQDTKIICINNPNNPTGVVIPDEMLDKIVEIARRADAYILCDEVYRGLNHDRILSASIADIYEKGISTGSVSKVFSLAGLRLGWITADIDIIKKISTHRQYNTISVGILDDYFASVAIENKEKIINRNISQILHGKEILLNWIKSNSHFRVIEPRGGTTAFVGYDMPVKSAELCANLQNDTGVMILPGETLELDGYLRIGYGNNHEKLSKALNIFSDWIRKKTF